MSETTREAMDYDVVIVGAGPAGLSAAIRLRQLCAAGGREISVCVIEKGAAVGDHILSGAVLEPRALDELVPDWKQRGAPVRTAVSAERFMFLTPASAIRLPSFALPPELKNHGNYIISLGNLCRWLATEAEALGVDIFPGFAAAAALCGDDGIVRGVITGDKGLARDGSRKASFEPGIELRGKYTLFAEGCRGSVSKTLGARFDLGAGADPQTYGIGIKELWSPSTLTVSSPLRVRMSTPSTPTKSPRSSPCQAAYGCSPRSSRRTYNWMRALPSLISENDVLPCPRALTIRPASLTRSSASSSCSTSRSSKRARVAAREASTS